MPLPFSRSHIERLGQRLIAGPEPADADIAELHQLLAAYDDVLTATLDRVRSAMDVAPTSRVKNTGTILEKLHRQGGSWLKSIQDLAGMRIVGAADRDEQDTIVERLVDLFADEARPPKVIDRRKVPSHGYRAVHVIVFPEDMAVEIQVRTRWQHEWADMFEKLADRVGRDIRYGAPPEGSGEPIEYTARVAVIRQAIGLAELIDAAENRESVDPSVLGELRDAVAQGLASLRENIEYFGH